MELNKKEKTADYYDDYYKNSKGYKLHYSKLDHYKMWEKAIFLIGEKETIFEIGCGSGQFADMATDHGYNYFGFDFSYQAIKIAKSLRLSCAIFTVANILDWKEFPHMDIYIIFEILEHIKDDIGILKRIPKGKPVLFSVPNFDYASHLRVFKDSAEILKRYSNLIKIKDIYKFNTVTKGKWWYLCYGKRNKS